MQFDLREIGSATMILFAVIDVLGSIPVLIDLENRLGDIHELKVALVSGAIMLGFLFLGERILALFGLDFNSFALAGAIVIFFIGIEMVLGIKLNKDETSSAASIVPVAFPLIAGTGTLTTLLTIRAEFKIENIITGIVINLIFVYLVIRNTKHFAKLLGPGGIVILRKVFGITLLAISIKIFRANIGIIH